MTDRPGIRCRCLGLNFFLSLFLFLFLACQGDSNYKPVDFSRTVSVAQPETQQAEHTGLRVAVAAMISPKETFVFYQELLDYIGARLGTSIQLIQRKTYGEINELFLKGQIDLAFICTGPYATGSEVFGFEGLATPIVRGQPFYQSYLIVNINSPYQELLDLKGRSFAFTDPDSNTGALVPLYWLAELGQTPKSFFKTVNYTYSHDNSILAVAKTLVDAAAVDGHKWEYYNRRNPIYTGKTRVIRKSEFFGGPPLVASKYLPDETRKRIRQTLFQMHTDPEGKRILDGLMIDQFVAPQEEWYQPVKRMVQVVRRSSERGHEAEKS